MTPTVILAAIVLLPVVVMILLRINAALVFLSLCLGDVLVQFVAPDANSLLSLFSANVSHTDTNTTKLLLLALPVILTAIFMIRTVHGGLRLLMNALPAVGTGLLAALLSVPLIAAGLRHNIVISPLWQQVQRAQDLIVGSSALICLLVLWLQRPKSGHAEGKHGKHHKG